MRSIWAGAISFGLVVIPVKLYAATEQRDITFRQVHRKDGARIQFRRVCTLDGEEVPYSDIAKGYELPTGDMVVLTDEDLADLPLVTAHRIEVLHFAPSAQVEPIYAAKSYYLEPESAGTRAYVLFRDALEASGKVAVAKVEDEAKTQDAAVAAANRSLEQSTNRYRGGLDTYLTVITAQSAALANERTARAHAQTAADRSSDLETTVRIRRGGRYEADRGMGQDRTRSECGPAAPRAFHRSVRCARRNL